MFNKNFFYSLIGSLVLLAASLVINVYAAAYAISQMSSPVTDLVLSNTRVYNTDWFFIYGAVIFWIIAIGLLVKYPRYMIFTIKTVSLFVLIRSLFITLTHIAPFQPYLIIEPYDLLADILGNKLYSIFFINGGLFFSGHTGLPFLFALIFWQKKLLRYLFLIFSITFGIVVLLGHLHYSIDVFAAFFITYSIYKLAKVLFKKDYPITVSL